MTNASDNPNPTDQGADVAIGELYRRAGLEKPSAGLDRRVLRLAREEVESDAPAGALPTWLRPAAMALSVVLGVALLLQFEPTATVGPVSRPEPATTAPAGVVENFNAAAADGSERLRAVGRDAALAKSPGEPTATDAAAVTTGAPGFCSAEQTASVAAWSRCIDDLARDGRDDAANSERERLLRAYPNGPLKP